MPQATIEASEGPIKLPRFPRRIFLRTATLITAAALAEASFPHIPYETEPYDLRDSTMWRLLRGPLGGVMKLCGGEDKQSNYWQWLKTKVPEFRPSAVLEGNFQTFVREDTIDDIRMSCHGINEIYQLKSLAIGDSWRIIFQTVKRAQSGILEPYEPTGHLFAGKLKGPIKFMRGNGDVRIYAMNEKGSRIPLEKSGPYSRNDRAITGLLI